MRFTSSFLLFSLIFFPSIYLTEGRWTRRFESETFLSFTSHKLIAWPTYTNNTFYDILIVGGLSAPSTFSNSLLMKMKKGEILP